MKESILIFMSPQELRSLIQEEIHAATKHLAPKDELPHYLTVQEAKDLLRVSHSKMYELIGRPTFPVCHEFGTRIPTDKLLKWIDEHTKGG